MAIKVSGTEVVSSSRELTNITGIDATTQATFENTLDFNNLSVGTVTGNATLDLSTGTVFEHTPTANTTFVFNNPPASGTAYKFDLSITGVESTTTFDLTNAYAEAWGGTGNFYSFENAGGASLQGFTFKADGTAIYVTVPATDTVEEYTLSTAWDLSTASYLRNLNVLTQDNTPSSLFFKPDGTKMYLTGTQNDSVYEYDLSSAWDISSASYLQTFSVAAQDTYPIAIFFKPDGTKMYICGFSGDDINEYDLSSAWDISSASYLQNFSVAAQEAAPRGLFFKPDGTKMYVVGSSGDDINEYDLSSAWDISSASYLQNASVQVQVLGAGGVYFRPDGLQAFVIDTTPASISAFPLSAAWDVSTIPTPTGYFSVKAEEGNPEALFFKPDGTKMYLLGSSDDDVNEYDLSSAWDITSATYLQNFSVSGQDGGPTGIFFKPDGTKMYVCGLVNDAVFEYALSSAWDVSTASYSSVSFSVISQDNSCRGIHFKSDGTKMYIIGTQNDSVYEYDLSSAWDISSASYLQTFSVAAQDNAPQDFFFSPTGDKMFVQGGVDPTSAYRYDLSTPWDVSTASYVESTSTAEAGTSTNALFLKPDGTRMYIVGSNLDVVYAFVTSATITFSFTYPASVKWPSGTAPTDPADGETDLLQFLTTDGGTTYLGYVLGDNFS